jgi:hypothetical protein
MRFNASGWWKSPSSRLGLEVLEAKRSHAALPCVLNKFNGTEHAESDKKSLIYSDAERDAR